ncbi:MAG: hypothetical protein, partial [Olavius algarvensis Gamma 1 endosymbiont]
TLVCGHWALSFETLHFQLNRNLMLAVGEKKIIRVITIRCDIVPIFQLIHDFDFENGFRNDPSHTAFCQIGRTGNRL